MFRFGVGIIRVEYLNPAPNQDQKRGIARAHFADIWWILRDHPYPANLWEVLPGNIKAEILSAKKGTARIVKLFDLIRETPISRTQIEAIAQQLDSLKRIRRNGGARDILAPRGIAVLSGVGYRDLIEKLGLKRLLADEFISYAPKNESEDALLKAHGHID